MKTIQQKVIMIDVYKDKLDFDPNTSRMTSHTDRNYEMEIEQFITFKKKFKQ